MTRLGVQEVIAGRPDDRCSTDLATQVRGVVGLPAPRRSAMAQHENFYRHLLVLCAITERHGAPEWTPSVLVQLEAGEEGVRLAIYRDANDESPFSAMVHFRRDGVRGRL